MNIIRNILFVIGLAFLISCEEVKEYPWNDNWNNTEQGPEENPEPEKPAPENPGTEEGPVVHEGKIRAVWIDAAANF